MCVCVRSQTERSWPWMHRLRTGFISFQCVCNVWERGPWTHHRWHFRTSVTLFAFSHSELQTSGRHKNMSDFLRSWRRCCRAFECPSGVKTFCHRVALTSYPELCKQNTLHICVLTISCWDALCFLFFRFKSTITTQTPHLMGYHDISCFLTNQMARLWVWGLFI